MVYEPMSGKREAAVSVRRLHLIITCNPLATQRIPKPSL